MILSFTIHVLTCILCTGSTLRKASGVSCWREERQSVWERVKGAGTPTWTLRYDQSKKTLALWGNTRDAHICRQFQSRNLDKVGFTVLIPFCLQRELVKNNSTAIKKSFSLCFIVINLNRNQSLNDV